MTCVHTRGERDDGSHAMYVAVLPSTLQCCDDVCRIAVCVYYCIASLPRGKYKFILSGHNITTSHYTRPVYC